MVALDVTEVSKSLAVAGGYTVLIGLVSYYIKEKLFVCEFTQLTHYPIT